MGIPLRLPDQRPPHPGPPRLGAVVQPTPPPQLPRQPATHQPCRTGPWSDHLAGAADPRPGWPRWAVRALARSGGQRVHARHRALLSGRAAEGRARPRAPRYRRRRSIRPAPAKAACRSTATSSTRPRS